MARALPLNTRITTTEPDQDIVVF